MMQPINLLPLNSTYPIPVNDEKIIRQKVDQLYEKRIKPYARNLNPEKKKIIIELQTLVFVLDHYFEQNKDINSYLLNSAWKEFNKSLNALGMPLAVQENVLTDIKDYARIEIKMRKGKKLAEYPIGFFYYKKSCDVRMQRHIIRYLNNEPVKSDLTEINRDIAEEIEDDSDDLLEDVETPFNGNRLLEIKQTGDITKEKEYPLFIKSLELPKDYADLLLRKLM